MTLICETSSARSRTELHYLRTTLNLIACIAEQEDSQTTRTIGQRRYITSSSHHGHYTPIYIFIIHLTAIFSLCGTFFIPSTCSRERGFYKPHQPAGMSAAALIAEDGLSGRRMQPVQSQNDLTSKPSRRSTIKEEALRRLLRKVKEPTTRRSIPRE